MEQMNFAIPPSAPSPPPSRGRSGRKNPSRYPRPHPPPLTLPAAAGPSLASLEQGRGGLLFSRQRTSVGGALGGARWQAAVSGDVAAGRCMRVAVERACWWQRDVHFV